MGSRLDSFLWLTRGERQSIKMTKKLIEVEMERDSLQQKWGITIQGGADLSLTAKIASVKRFSPADRAGLEKMDYVWTVNGKEVFGMTQPQITSEILNSQLKMTMEVERGTFIVPSFDEIWPQAGKQREKARKRMGMEYILEAMQHHGLGHLPQPDNFTTCGRLGIEVNQYNNPIECYADETIEDMREEKVIIDHPELADKLLKSNTEKHKEHQMNPIAAQKLKSANFDPKRSAVMMAINAQ